MSYLERNVKMKFDVVIGNPPYQENSGTSARDEALYNYFYDLSEKIGEKYMLISPARFLFNAGSTLKSWNRKMLKDKHVKVVYYEQDSSKIFPNVGIAGGVAILFRDNCKTLGPIGFFTSFKELYDISQRIALNNEMTMDTIISGRGIYRLTPIAHKIFPQIEKLQSKGHKNDIGTGAFDKFDKLLFFEEKPKDNNDYILVQGRFKNSRTQRYIQKDLVNVPDSFNKWRVILPKAYGTGISTDGKAASLIGEPFIIEPEVAFTETYISIGSFKNRNEALNALKYIKSKFARALLAILKITQDNTKEKWSKVPLQDFTESSDIDWSVSISEIDKQLYKKYELSQEEISFIETKVKSME